MRKEELDMRNVHRGKFCCNKIDTAHNAGAGVFLEESILNNGGTMLPLYGAHKSFSEACSLKWDRELHIRVCA